MVSLGYNNNGLYKLNNLKVKVDKDPEKGRETQSKLESHGKQPGMKSKEVKVRQRGQSTTQ